MLLENLFKPEIEKTSNSHFYFDPNVIPTCWAGVNNPLFTFDNDYYIQMTTFMIFKTDSWMVMNKYEKAKKVWEEYAELEQEGFEIEKVQRWMMKREEIERKDRINSYKEEAKIVDTKETIIKSECLNDIDKNKDETNGQLIIELTHNENSEVNDENTLRNEDSFKSEDLDSSNNKTKTNDIISMDRSQMDNDKCNNSSKEENSIENNQELDLELDNKQGSEGQIHG